MNRSTRRKTLFIFLCILAIISYGYFVYAAAPTGGYDPGAILDPDCAPGDVDCVVKPPLTTADNGLTAIGSNVQLGGTLLQATEINQNGNNFSFIGGNVGVGTNNPNFTLDIGGNSTYTVTGQGFYGTLDDMLIDISGYSGPAAVSYNLYVSSASNPDEITWSDDQGNTGTFQITGGADYLSYGTAVSFSNVTGHAGDEGWSFSVGRTSLGILNVSDNINIGGNFFATQINSSVFLGDGVATPFVGGSLFVGGRAGRYANGANNSIFIGNEAGAGATNASQSNFLGAGAGQDAISADNSNFFGLAAGQAARSAYASNFFGYKTGVNAENASQSNFMGSFTGNEATNANDSNFLGAFAGNRSMNANNSNFFGFQAGYRATNAAYSNFFGLNAGAHAEDAYNSTFIGQSAGESASRASNSIFIGMNAGSHDGVNNTGGDWSILIGDNTSTGGFSSSIALGAGATNTMANQFLLADKVEYVNLRGINYHLPDRDGGAGDVLTTDGAGELSWLPAGAGSVSADNGLTLDHGTVILGGILNQNTKIDGDSNSYNFTFNNLGTFLVNKTDYVSLSADQGVTITTGKDIQISTGNGRLQLSTAGIQNTHASNGQVLTLIDDATGEAEWQDLPTGGSSGLQWYAEDSNAPVVAPIAAQPGSIALGDGAKALSTNMFVYGNRAGEGAIHGTNSVFMGLESGLNATDATNSNFMGYMSGSGATNATQSNFFGSNAGINATNATFANFIGYRSGRNATNAAYSNFFGDGAGNNAVSANNSNFFGLSAGQSATNASYSNFIGSRAGESASGATNSNFFGQDAGYQASSAAYSNFFGDAAGSGATNADGANFIGFMAGGGATNAARSNFFGENAGNNATNASYSNFIGSGAGINASSAPYSNFIGQGAGNSATNATLSNFFGTAAGQNATNASSSNFLGRQAGFSATNASFSFFAGENAGRYDLSSSTGTPNAAHSIFIGTNAGFTTADNALNNTTSADDYSILFGNNTSTGGFKNSIAIGANATNTAVNQLVFGSTTRPLNSVFIGDSKGTASTNFTFFAGAGAGLNATNASNAIFIGRNAGNAATLAGGSIFMGLNAGQNATNAANSIFLGQSAGANASGAVGSSFMGRNAGSGASSASESTFIGNNAGSTATNANLSTFIGNNAGLGAINAAHSIAIGYAAGQDINLNNTTDANDYSIMIGSGSSAGGFSNSIALGSAAVNTASNQFIIGSTLRPINETRFQGSVIGTQCTITTGTGIACTSDERLKENIIDLDSGILEKLMNVKTVNYELISDTSNKLQIGFLAQNLEQYFPELVDTDRNSGYKSVYYAQMAPILVEAIREMNLNVTMLSDMTRSNTWRDSLIVWFGNINNGIGDFFANRAHVKELCIGENGNETCLSKSQVDKIIQATDATPTVYYPVGPTPDPSTPPVLDDTPPPDDSIPQTGDDTNTTESTPPPSVEPTPPVTE